MQILLDRDQINKTREHANPLDVTVKSATEFGKLFAPTWEMVIGYKQERFSAEKYTKQYLSLLDQLPVEAFRALWHFGKEAGEITFICYCPNNTFCHTHILINYLVGRFRKGFMYR